MPKAKLDQTFCLGAQCGQGVKKTVYWDTGIPGFVLECRQGGRATYALRYTDAAGRQRQHKIGCRDTITCAQARKRAQSIRAAVELGGNPQEAKAEKKSIPSYAEIAARHQQHNQSFHKRPENTDSVIRVHLLPRWGRLRLDEIKSADIDSWLASLRRKGLAPATIEKIRVTFSRSFELAAKWDVPGAQVNPVRAVSKVKFNNKREAFLSKDEAQRLIAACKLSMNPQLQYIVKLLLLTGARKSELLRAQWEHVDLGRATWHIPDSKTGKPRNVPLSKAALEVIAQIRRYDGCPWLLPNPATRKPFTDIKHPWETARAKAGLHTLRLHDLRHSAASFMVNAGIDLFAVGKVLGHADYQSTMRYAHLADATLRAAVEAGAANMKGI